MTGVQTCALPISNAFPFSVFISCQYQLVGIFERVLEGFNDLLFVAGHDVNRVEVALDIDAELRPFLLLVRRRNFARRLGQIAHVTHRCFDAVALGEIFLDRARFCGGLDDDEGGHSAAVAKAGSILKAGERDAGDESGRVVAACRVTERCRSDRKSVV